MSSGIRQAVTYVALVVIAGVLAFVVTYTLASGSNSSAAPVAENRPVVASPSLATATPDPTPTLAPIPTPTPLPPTPAAIPSIVLPTPTPEPVVSVVPETDPVMLGLVVVPPDLSRTRGRWIDVNLGDGNTRLMDGHTVVKELPSAWGYGTPATSSDYYSTPPDLYFVYEKRDELHYDETFATGFFRGWVGFDPERANGFHSFILDRQEKIIDARVGPVSHGCVRVEDWRALYDFAEVGMPVTIHNAPTAKTNSTTDE